uniref:Sulfatase N-terminal domain-containing protein n=1 Tax=Pseudo-nitzschia australis TaxID=44445 RepID=A0A7S4AU34_9STRA|mmetsp:Transcript_18096/g.39441  ORF Transcript_18096/g.39441 Transcript_18096/m.39441 type:complete len:654 (+) Transcript_18096:50-2011(+)
MPMTTMMKMMNRSSNKAVFIFVAAFAFACCCALIPQATAAASTTATSTTSTRTTKLLPNIVVIVLDDLGSHDLGLHGTGIHTPNIDGFVTANNNGNDSDNDDNKNYGGIYLEEYYVLPYCSPTRAALLSGMYPLRTGVHNVIREKSTAGLPLNVETLPEMLKRARVQVPSSSATATTTTASKPSKTHTNTIHTYKTHAVGKWHLGHSSWDQTPTFRGFDSFFGFYMGGQDYFSHKSLGALDLHFDKEPRCGQGCSEVVFNERGNYSTHVFTREAISVVKNHHLANTAEATAEPGTAAQSQSSPLFLYLAYQAVHCPNEVPAEYIERYKNKTDWTDQRKNYAGMLTAADEGIGNLTKALKETGLWENTLLIVTTDNGGPTTVGCVQGSSNYPKRGGKCSLWEGGTTGDALVAGPALDNLLLDGSGGVFIKTTVDDSSNSNINNSRDHHRQRKLRKQQRFRHLFHVVDWFPTLAEWVGVVPNNQTILDGVSQADALSGSKGDQPARIELFGGYAQCEQLKPKNYTYWWGPTIRHLNWKLVQGESAGPDAQNSYPLGSTTIQFPGDSAGSTSGGGGGKYLLFDLEKDPREENDVSRDYPDVLQSMIYKLKLYRKSFVYPQLNDDSKCPFPGFNKSAAEPAWIPWCKDLQANVLALQ